MSRSEEHTPFELKDFFHENPLREIYSKGRGDRYFANAYIDFSQDFETLRISWRRIRQGCKDIGELDTRIRTIQSNEMRIDDVALLHGLMNILQSDIRAFIDIARTIMDKIAKLIEKLLDLSPGKGKKVSFTDHKKRLPVQHPNIRPAYLDFLKNRTYWYEQELLLLRDKVFAHGNTFITSWQVSLDGGIKIIKRSEFEGLEGKNKTVYLDIKKRYEKRYSNLKVRQNDYVSSDKFLRQIRKLNTKLDEEDIPKLSNIVSSFGIITDEEFLESIAKHLEEFMGEITAIFKDST